MLGLQCFHIVGSPAVQVVDIGRNGVALCVHTNNAADNAVPHNGTDLAHVQSLGCHLPAAIPHTLFNQLIIFPHIHLYPARLRVEQGGRSRCHSHFLACLIVNGNLHTLGSCVKPQIIFFVHTDTVLYGSPRNNAAKFPSIITKNCRIRKTFSRRPQDKKDEKNAWKGTKKKVKNISYQQQGL